LLEDPRQPSGMKILFALQLRFNPCFAGRPSPTKPGLYHLFLGDVVSILVLLEDPRQPE